MELVQLNKSKSEQRVRSLRCISIITASLVSILALCSFVLSFEALCEFASTSGAIASKRAWIFPIVVDGGILCFSVSACRCSILHEDKRWPLLLVTTGTVLSVIFNISHGPGGLIPALVSATPPLVNFLALETLMRQIESNFAQSRLPLAPEAGTASGPTKDNRARAKLAEKQRPVAPNGSVPSKRAEVLRLLEGGHSKRSVARQLSVAVSTVRRLAVLAQD